VAVSEDTNMEEEYVPSEMESTHEEEAGPKPPAKAPLQYTIDIVSQSIKAIMKTLKDSKMPKTKVTAICSFLNDLNNLHSTHEIQIGILKERSQVLNVNSQCAPLDQTTDRSQQHFGAPYLTDRCQKPVRWMEKGKQNEKKLIEAPRGSRHAVVVETDQTNGTTTKDILASVFTEMKVTENRQNRNW
jgi:hypothetical protein